MGSDQRSREVHTKMYLSQFERALAHQCGAPPADVAVQGNHQRDFYPALALVPVEYLLALAGRLDLYM